MTLNHKKGVVEVKFGKMEFKKIMLSNIQDIERLDNLITNNKL